MPQSSEEKRDRFARMFPPRVEKLVKQLQLLENCTTKSTYEWTPDIVKRAWIEIGQTVIDTCAAYDMDLDISLDGKRLSEYDTSKPLNPKEDLK